MDLLNKSFQQIQPISSSNVSELNSIDMKYSHDCLFQSTAVVDDRCEQVYQQLRTAFTSASNPTSEIFFNLSNSLDDLDRELTNVYTFFQNFDLPLTWIQSPLFDWKPGQREFLKNFFAMSKIATIRQICQLTIDHLHTFDSKTSSTNKFFSSSSSSRYSISNNQRCRFFEYYQTISSTLHRSIRKSFD